MGKYFGTDGFRGEANVTLTVEHAFKIGRFLGWYYGERKHSKCKVVIGKDTRRSSYMFEYSLVAGLTASGADVYLLHVTTTPSVSYVARTEDFDCGIMISASHNAFGDNGIKLVNCNGEKMDDETIAEIEKYLDNMIPEIPVAKGEKIGCTIDHSGGRNRYIGYIISLATRSYQGKKIGLDCANGSAWMIAKSVFDALGAKTYVINNQPNGLNINKNCGSTNVEGLRKLVVENGLDIGFAFDGDADRCICVDEKGNVVNGDGILYVCGCFMKEQGILHKNTIVTTVMSNLGLYKALDEEGIGYEQTMVGDRHIYENMSKNGYSLGGEESGHVIFKQYASTGDGFITAIKIMEVMIEKKMPLSELASPMHVYPQMVKSVRVGDKSAVKKDMEIQEAVQEVARKLGSNGRVLLRESGTEPVVRIMVEATDDTNCKENVDYLCDLICRKGYTV